MINDEDVSPKERYQSDLDRRGFHADAEQLNAVEYLQRLYEQLLQPVQPQSFLDRLLKRRREAIRGLYLWGGVGRGKTYLMDSFYDSLSSEWARRVHFHHFMRQLHEELQSLPKTPDPLPIVAKRLAARVRVLCLDEFHVHDIGDAMLLSGFLKALFENGVTLVTTSNIDPDQLYKNGLQRSRFMPAIELIKRYTQTLHLDAGRDYRLELLERGGTYHVLVGDEAEELLTRQFEQLATNAVSQVQMLNINHREIAVRRMSDDVAWFDFQPLCATPRSAADYLEIARMFHTVLVAGIPLLGEATDDVAQRFIHLVDALYDHNVKLIATAAQPPQGLYSGQRHTFAFQRTTSRLLEMASAAYLKKAHRM